MTGPEARGEGAAAVDGARAGRESREVVVQAGRLTGSEGSASLATLEARIAGALAERRRGLVRRFGWAGPGLRCAVEPRRRTLAVEGEALSQKALAATLDELRAVLPARWAVDARGTQIAAPREWLTLPPGVTRLWRAPVGVGIHMSRETCASGHVIRDLRSSGWHGESAPGPAPLKKRRGSPDPDAWELNGSAVGLTDEGLLETPRPWFGAEPDRRGSAAAREWTDAARRRGHESWCPEGHVREDIELCTELLPGDGPVGVLAAVGGWLLVRASDGTIGWTRARLGLPAASPAPAVAPARAGAAALTRALRGFRGAPYRLGGTTSLGIDCSGLVQRAVRAALGVVLPRHSSDQLALAAAPVRALGEPGDLLFLWGAGESPCHVGVVLRGPRPGMRTLLHASSRRGRVIEEPLDLVLPRAARLRHVELEQVLALRP